MCLENYFATRKNKRYGRDHMEFEVSWASNLYRFFRDVKERTLRIDHNYAFLVSRPKWREIFATSFKGRMADHLLCDMLAPYIDRELSPRTFNNRKGLGAKAAVNQVIEDVYDVTEGHSKPARIIKWDISGFFPSARWNVMQDCYDMVIDKHQAELSAEYGEDVVDMLHWLSMLCVNSSPAMHCELRTPSHMWRDHIEMEKSMFERPLGEGAPIGRLSSQHGMGLYLNDIVIWLNEECLIKTSVFVDDGTMVVPEESHAHALSVIVELKRRMAEIGLKLNERKFYDQPYQNGLELLGRHIRPNRIHLNNKNYGCALERVDEFNHVKDEERLSVIDRMVASLNSYGGLLKGCTDYKRLIAMRDRIDAGWWKYLEWDSSKLCLNVKPFYSWRSRMNRKYKLRLSERRVA